MDTLEIQEQLSKIHPCLQNNVYAANRLPIHVEIPIFLISNLDPDTKPGSHWIAIHIDKNGIGQYFDSYGRPPSFYHKSFLNRNSKQWYFNSHRIQNNLTSVCGEYCIMYLYYKFYGETMNDFVGIFCYPTLVNDVLVYNMFKSFLLMK